MEVGDKVICKKTWNGIEFIYKKGQIYSITKVLGRSKLIGKNATICYEINTFHFFANVKDEDFLFNFDVYFSSLKKSRKEKLEKLKYGE